MKMLMQNMHVDNASTIFSPKNVVNYDEVESGNQMATTINDAFQACQVANDESMKEAGDLNRLNVFNLVNNINIEGGDDEGGYELGQTIIL